MGRHTRWRIWIKYFDLDKNLIGFGTHPVDYAHKSSAVRRAKQLWGQNPSLNPAAEWIVSKTNPFKDYREGGL